jgi:hypothetical protein
MDGFSFDALTRSLTTAGSRRRALAALLLGSLGFLGAQAEETAAKNCKKIKNKKKRKKCLAKAKMTPSCTRNCAGKSCGDDGCGGSCGDCFRGTCQGGVCRCPSGQELCNGACMTACAQDELRDPDTCRCCSANISPCGIGSHCCSGDCGGSSGLCQGRNGLEACTWGEQCRSGVCEAGKCTCDGDICDGICRVLCSSPQESRNWETCGCCKTNGTSCATPGGGECNSCCCSGDCNFELGDRCAGRGDCDPCTFDEQCAQGLTCRNERCSPSGVNCL